MADDKLYDDQIQHGIDDNPVDDAKKGAVIGGIGGAAVGIAAGAMAGPVGAVIGAVVGGAAGAIASGAAVAAVDRVDNDNTVSGMGEGVTTDMHDRLDDEYDVDDTMPVAGAATTTAVYGTAAGYSAPASTAGIGASYPGAVGTPTSSGYDANPTRPLDTAATDDGIQHGIDDNPYGDAKKGAVVGGIGGAAVGAAAGSLAGPAGTAAGAVIGGAAGAGASGAAVARVDRVDNDNKVSGVGEGVTPKADFDDEDQDADLLLQRTRREL